MNHQETHSSRLARPKQRNRATFIHRQFGGLASITMDATTFPFSRLIPLFVPYFMQFPRRRDQPRATPRNSSRGCISVKLPDRRGLQLLSSSSSRPSPALLPAKGEGFPSLLLSFFFSAVWPFRPYRVSLFILHRRAPSTPVVSPAATRCDESRSD